jgi:hypothetical protein
MHTAGGPDLGLEPSLTFRATVVYSRVLDEVFDEFPAPGMFARKPG